MAYPGFYLTVLLVFILTMEMGAQHTITGVVYDHVGETMPGVDVHELTKPNGTSTNGDGMFSLKSPTLYPTLQFSFLGFVSKNVQVDSSHVIVTLEPDTVVLNEKILCCVANRYTKVGISSGLWNTTLGLKLDNQTPYLSGNYTSLNVGFEWRMRQSSNQYVNVYINPHRITGSNVVLGFYSHFKFIRITQSETREWIVSPELSFRNVRLTAGYVRQQYQTSENSREGSGIQASFFSHLFNHATIRLSASYVHQQLQYQGNIYWEIGNSRIILGSGLERLGDMDEVSVSVQYKLRT